MIGLLNPWVWLLGFGMLLGAYGTGRWQQYQSDEKTAKATQLDLTNAARQQEQNWQINTEALQEVKDEELRKVGAQRDAALASLRQRAQQRLPDAAQASCAGASPAALAAPDAAVALGYAAEFDALRAEYSTCRSWAQTLKPQP